MSPDAFLNLATILFSIGLVGIVSRKNLFVIYMSVELMLSSVNLALATFSRLHQSLDGSVMALLIIALIAAEASVFLAMIIHLYRIKRSVNADAFSSLSQGESQ